MRVAKTLFNKIWLETAVLVILAVSTCFGFASDTLVIGLAEPVETFDPGNYRDRTTETVLRNMFDGLVTRTPDGQVVLEIAESAQMIDEKTMEFVIKQGILFHNGDRLTADDVKFSFDRIIGENGIDYPEPHTSPRKSLLAPLNNVEVIDEYRVRLHFESPWPVVMQMLVHQKILPGKYFKLVGNEGFGKAPVGCGPFKFVEVAKDGQIVMSRFDGYYGGSDAIPPVGPAAFKKLVFQVIPGSQERIWAVQTGKVQIIQEVPIQLVGLLEVTPYVKVKTGPGTTPVWMEMNVNRFPFDDLRVRRAINMGVDPARLNRDILNSRGVVLTGPLSPFNDFYDPLVTGDEPSLERAAELLCESGWTRSKENGLLEKDGNTLSFTLDMRAAHSELGNEVARQLGLLGCGVEVEVWDDVTAMKKSLLNGEREAYIGNWGDSAFDPIGFIEAKCHTFSKGSSYGRGNYSGYSNAQVDQLIRAGEVESNFEVRQEIYSQIQRILLNEVPAVFLVLPQAIEASSIVVQNWRVSADGRLNMHDVWLSW